ncbi:hypothetical protein QFC22_002539 [Naganishia vaughanmartiniae]|uniref:Uncharacterized protein n=1 Tax=Naganishia vaughanmartiniae TaxID=1424756 RepID=A0ACC2X998_9TREE|nr:hypothetical protein QFC22_002539 [Naganishia vaughanmartiniae]
MKAVIQKVTNASVTVEGQVISSIGRGLMVLVGIGVDDTPKDREYIIRKILSIRLFDAPTPIAASDAVEGEELKERQKSSAWRASVKDIGGEVLCVSQFTLMAKVEKGSKPDFHGAMTTLPSSVFYNEFLGDMRTAYSADKIQDGKFGAMMQVSLCNDGPVTITIDSKAKPPSAPQSRANTPFASGESTPASDNRKPQQTLAEKKEKRARAAEAYAKRKNLETTEQQLS